MLLIKENRLIYDLSDSFQKIKATKYLKNLFKNESIIDLKKYSPKRSNPQNRYYHALLKIFALEYGCYPDEAKTMSKHHCEFMKYEKYGIIHYKSTADLSTKEYVDFIECFRNWSMVETNIYLPSADEFQGNEGQIMEFVRVNSKWLGGGVNG